MDVNSVGGINSMLFGGEGMFLATLTGPGTVWLQSLPFSRMAGRMLAAAPQSGGKDRGEGSVLGGIGRLLDRSEEHTSELQSLMRISYAVFCLKTKTQITT